jgi:hypothetical protein
MSFIDNVICPVSNVKIDSNVSRLTVFLNAICLALFVSTHIPWLVILVAVDYGIRVMGQAEYSPMRWVAVKIAGALKWSAQPIDQAPKLFAARLGFLFSAGSALFFTASLPASLVLGSILLVFATLDSVFDFCVGCLTYTYAVLPFYKWRGIR